MTVACMCDIEESLQSVPRRTA